MKNRLKAILHLAVSILASFILIYFLVFIGGWRLLESGDPILIEIAVSVIVGMLVFVIYEVTQEYDKRLAALESRISELEGKADGEER